MGYRVETAYCAGAAARVVRIEWRPRGDAPRSTGATHAASERRCCIDAAKPINLATPRRRDAGGLGRAAIAHNACGRRRTGSKSAQGGCAALATLYPMARGRRDQRFVAVAPMALRVTICRCRADAEGGTRPAAV